MQAQSTSMQMYSTSTYSTSTPRIAPQSGFDKLVLSAPGVSQYASQRSLGPKDFSRLLDLGYHSPRIGNPAHAKEKPKKPHKYSRYADYRHPDPSFPLVGLRYKPVRLLPNLPAFQLWIRASGRDLLDVDAVEKIVEGLPADLGLLYLANVEFTFDLPGDGETAHQLHRQFYSPRTRQAGRQHGDTSWSWGAGSSGSGFRLYHKPEDPFVRTECNLRTPALKRYSIRTISELREVAWSSFVPSRLFRFAEFAPTTGCHADVQREFANRVREQGVKAALQAFPQQGHWLRGHLVPSSIQRCLERSLVVLEERLQPIPVAA